MQLHSEQYAGYSVTQVSEDNDFCLLLERIDLLFQQDYIQWAQGSVPVTLQHFFLPDNEINLRLEKPHGSPHWEQENYTFLPDENEILSLRLNTLVNIFHLDEIERNVLMVTLLPRLSQHYALLPDSGMADGVNLSLLRRLLVNTPKEYQRLYSVLHPTSTLLRYCLIVENDKTGKSKKNTPDYSLNESIWHFLCGNELQSTSLYSFVHRIEAIYPLKYPQTLYNSISSLSLTLSTVKSPIIILEGHEEDGRQQTLATIVASHLRATLCLDFAVIAQLSETLQKTVMGSIVRDALLENSVLILDNCTESGVIQNALVQKFEKLLIPLPLSIFIVPHNHADVPVFTELACVHLSMPLPDISEKSEWLYKNWPDKSPGIKESLKLLAQRYTFNFADIPVLMQEAEHYRQIRDINSSLDVADLRQTLTYRSRKNFGKLAQRITPIRTFKDIVLSPALQKQLSEILAYIHYRESVTEKHFMHKLGGKTGVSALFYGDSGTGKTLAAEVIAQYLEVDLIKVDLSTVVNKYIGETEKNLARIFDLAQTDSGVLFFDEADALFGKRSETKDAHDRHANIEVSYLLQRLEAYPGLVILATNNRHHLDSAFTRRFTFITRFTYPDVTLRKEMWKAIWPSTLNLAKDIDFSVLAARNELTGANIRNIALLAAVLAAADNSKIITQEHIDRATNRELGKLGRLSL